MCLKTGYSLQTVDKNSGVLIFGTTKNSPEEEWQLIEVKSDTYIIKGNKGLVIDVSGGAYKSEAKPILYNQHGDKNQQWVLEKV